MSDAVLATHNLCKKFGAVSATENVSIDLQPGEIHAVIGPNGAGKSTLIRQVCGTLPPDSGHVTLMGYDLSGLSASARAKKGLGRTFQISELAMEDTVLQNAVIGALLHEGGPWRFWRPALGTPELVEKADAALDRVGLADYRNTRCAFLSHGQRRQLEVALALTLDPKVFIMDEPMAGLGADGSKAMTDFLGTLKEEAPILLVEHDMDAVFALADRISVLVYGKIIATGSVNDIRASREVREAYLGDEA